MNSEMILDAMNYLDDDLIEATAKFRNRKRRPYWLAAVAAACLCLFVLSGKGATKAPMESNKSDALYSGTSDEMKQESHMESPMASAQTCKSVLRITELGEDFITGTVQYADGGDLSAQLLTVFCDPEIAVTLAVGDVVQVVYVEENGNYLLELQLIDE